MRGIFGLFLRWYQGRQRQLDIDLLWPSCRDLAPDLHNARAAFATHAFSDPAWLALGREGVNAAIDALT